MQYSKTLAVATLVACASAHGVVTSIQGANGVTMPGLTVADGTPRDCSTNRCGSQADTAIIRDGEIASGEVGPLGRTQGNGPVNAATMIENFMGTGTAPTNKRAVEQMSWVRRQLSNLLGGVLGGGGGGGQGQKTSQAEETAVAASAGEGASSGLPTCAEDGTVTMTFRQINQDGAGPMEAAIDATSGGTDADAFQNAEVTQDVPGLGIAGLSTATNTDFPMQVQMPQGMTCEGSVGGVNNVCVVRVRNNTPAGPFGGSAAFTQSTAARKRAIEYRRKMKRSSESSTVRNGTPPGPYGGSVGYPPRAVEDRQVNTTPSGPYGGTGPST